ncbi:hypothetical protein Taro_033265 [Colocasia esculenta]|uniref:HAT C-terminal dimerisation domain-containing protein n=1 Tax=Colocasia esculenta TaxID=4460 RepID=A0A843VNE7_COLES|nr:hypothetical protein [Colocasia esculenta]
MSRDLHMAVYYLHLAYHYAHELAYEDDLTAAFTRVVERLSRSPVQAADAIDEATDWWFNFGHTAPTLRKVAVKILSQTSSSSGCERNWSTFALIHTKLRNRLSYRHLDQLVYVHYNMRLRVKHLTEDPKQRGDVEYDPVDIGFLRDEEDPMVAWVARATTERGEYELDEEADDPEDPPHSNTFLARAVAEATAEEEGDRRNVGQPYSPRYEMDLETEVDLLGDIELEHVERTIGGGHGHDDDDHFERLMEGLPRTQSRRRGSSTQDAPPSQSTRAPTSSQLAKGKQIAQESRRKKTGATESRSTKGVVIRKSPPPPVQKKKRWFSGWGSKKGKKGIHRGAIFSGCNTRY